ncbi:MAG TPA: hypothetical protein VFV67_04630 [Actinophytocola sp.]|nr:hypothetical protein [Actinophytocola sp.]
MRVIVGAATLLLMVAGCGSDQESGASAGQPGSSSESASASQLPSGLPPGQPSDLPVPEPGKPAPPPEGGVVLPENQADLGGLPPYYDKKEVVVAPDGNSVTVWGMARDSCSRVTGKITEESAEVVRIVLVPMPAPQGGPVDQACTQVLTPVPVTVQLKAPLGNRKVIVTEQETY